MGQYYRAVIETNGKVKGFSTYVDGEYMLAKLMEHSYWANPYVLAIASKFWRTKGRLAWVGDYADEDDFNWNPIFENAWNKEDNSWNKKDLVYNGFRLEGKYFINHSKKKFIDLDRYYKMLADTEQYFNPVSLLTAVGNGKGGGDFRGGTNEDLIGSWAWDVIEITDQDIYDYSYNADKREWEESLKPEFADYADVTDGCIFVED